jgi:hypothetical protein
MDAIKSLTITRDILSTVLTQKFELDSGCSISWSEIRTLVIEDQRCKEISQHEMSQILTETICTVFKIQKKQKGRGGGFPLKYKVTQGLVEILGKGDEASSEMARQGIEEFVENNLSKSEDATMTMDKIIIHLLDSNPSYTKIQGNSCLGRILGETMSTKFGISKARIFVLGKRVNVWPVKYVPTSGLEMEGLRFRTRGSERSEVQKVFERSKKETAMIFFSAPSKQKKKKSQSFAVGEDFCSDDEIMSFEDENDLLSVPEEENSIRKLESLDSNTLKDILLSFLPLLGARYSVHFPIRETENPNTIQFGARVNDLDCFFHFGSGTKLVRETGSWGRAFPCPFQVRKPLLTWLQEKALCKADLSKVAGEVIVRGKSQKPHSDSSSHIIRVHTLDIASAGSLQLLDPHKEVKGSYSWENSTNRKHFGKVGPLKHSENEGRVVIVFREYTEELYSQPYEGKELNRWRANDLLYTAVQKELFPILDTIPNLNLFDICKTLVELEGKLLSLNMGGYNTGEGIGCAPSQVSAAGAMNPIELEATLPGLKLGCPLPAKFILPFGDKRFLWGMGFHRDLYKAVKWDSVNGLQSIRLSSSKIKFADYCPHERNLNQEVDWKENWMCSLGCCAIIPLNDLDRQSLAIGDIMKKIFRPFLYIQFEQSTHCSEIHEVHVENGVLFLRVEKMTYPASSILTSVTSKFRCKGVETNSVLKQFVSESNGKFIARTYQKSNLEQDTSTVVAMMSHGQLKYSHCESMEVDSPNELCLDCKSNQKILSRSNIYFLNSWNRKILIFFLILQNENGSWRKRNTIEEIQKKR